MRYTEDIVKQSESTNILDLIRNGFLSLYIAPFRLVNEITKKLMFLEREVLEKLSVTMAGLVTTMLLWDCIYYLISGQIKMFGGFLPVFSKLVVLVIVGGFAYYLTKVVKLPYELVANETLVEEVDAPTTYEKVAEVAMEPVEELKLEKFEQPDLKPIVTPALEALVATACAPIATPVNVEDVVESEVVEEEEIMETVVELSAPESTVVVDTVTVEESAVEEEILPLSVYSQPLDLGEELLVDLSALHTINIPSLEEEEDRNPDLIAPSSVDFMTRMLEDSTLFGNDPEDLVLDVGRGSARQIMSVDNIKEGL